MRQGRFDVSPNYLDALSDTFLYSQLELLLDSQIATTSNLALLHQIVRRPSEDTWTYRKPDPPFETDLFKRLHTEFGDIKALDSTFRFALSATSELGSWCADQVWARAIVEEVIPKLDNSINKAALNYGVGVIDQAEKDIQRSRKACDIVKAHPFKDPRETGQLSSKVEILLTILSHHFRQTAEKRCIVFVQQRNTARVLLDLCEQISIPNFRPGILVGVSSSDLIGATSFRQQFLTLVKFRKGEINCLVSYSIDHLQVGC